MRALASALVPGQVIGPTLWRGTRRGDPNDRVPHEDRRELRGLRLFYVWLNNPDAKPSNSVDTWIAAGTGGVVRHYLLDFGTTLGAGGSGPARAGWWHRFAWRPSLHEYSIASTSATRDQARSLRRTYEDDVLVGSLTADVDPVSFRFVDQNPAFVRMDGADAAWALRRLAAFDDAQIAAAVEAAAWPPAEAERAMTT